MHVCSILITSIFAPSVFPDVYLLYQLFFLILSSSSVGLCNIEETFNVEKGKL